MGGNLLILVILIGLTVLCTWLTRRAVQARSRWVKFGGAIAAGLITLTLVLVTSLGVIGMLRMYGRHDPPVPAGSVATRTPQLLERGQYLATISCAGCHSSNGDYQPPLAGGMDMAAEIPLPIGSIIASNIAPDGQIAEYTDEQLFRAIRHGIRHDGSQLAFMSSLAIREYSDDDILAIIAYLRAQPPANSAVRGGDDLNFVAALLYGTGLFPAFTPAPTQISAPPRGITPEYGLYVATLGDCRGCHGATMTGTPASAVSPAMPNPRHYVSTLTLDQFRHMMRTGLRPDGRPLDMPWQNASHMTDDDLAALYALLSTSTP